jgi:hypothetical protein
MDREARATAIRKLICEMRELGVEMREEDIKTRIKTIRTTYEVFPKSVRPYFFLGK